MKKKGDDLCSISMGNEITIVKNVLSYLKEIFENISYPYLYCVNSKMLPTAHYL